MKKLLLSLVVFAMVIASANAQTSFGVRAGANLANIGGDETDDAKMKIGYHVGAYANIGLTDKFSLEPGLFLSSKGFKEKYSETIEVMGQVIKFEDEGTTTLTYLDIPVLARVNIASGFNVFVGPQLSFLLGKKAKWESTEEGVTESGEDSSTEGLNKLDLGLLFGVGYQLENGLNFNLGYDLGLSNIHDEKDSDFKNSNRVIQISVGFNF